MTINRIIKSLSGKKKTFQFPKFRDPINFLIGDSNGGRRRRYSRKAYRKPVLHKVLPLKRHEITTNISDISSTVQAISLIEIPQGTGTDSARTEQQIFADHVNIRTTLLWDDASGGNVPVTVRFILASVKGDMNIATSGITAASNILDKRDFPDIGHVYADFRVLRRNADSLATPVKIFRRLKRKFLYDGDASTDHAVHGYNGLYLIVVADVATATETSTNQTNIVVRYRG